MRSKYASEELKAMDDIAYDLGIELIPSIQTMAHLRDVLKWPGFGGIKEDEDTLLPGEPATYQFIEEVISGVSASFRTKRIHIGYDEAWRLGLGNYLIKHGLRNKFEIMTEHLNEVVTITSKYGLTPLMFSDMYFRTPKLSGYGDNYDPDIEIPEPIVNSLPQNVQMVFWEYNRCDSGFYEKVIDKHKAINEHVVFAGGIWNWMGFPVNYGLTFKQTNTALNVCKERGVKEVYATLWGDDNTENNLFTTMLGWQLFAEHGYSKTLDEGKLRRRFKFCTGGDYKDFMDMRYLDEIPGIGDDNAGMANPSKYLLFQNSLLGMFDKNIEGMHLNDYYGKMAERMRQAIGRNGKYDELFELLERLASALSMKAELGVQLSRAYKHEDREELRRLVQEVIPELKCRIEDLRSIHRDQWYRNHKPFGWEVTDLRYGGVLLNLDTASMRINSYLGGELDRIEELEETRLYYNGVPGLHPVYSYKKIPSGSRLFH